MKLQFQFQMNESKLRRGTKYVSLKDEDIHTVTGALKQFFRELKTDLIPIEIVKNLPNDLGECTPATQSNPINSGQLILLFILLSISSCRERRKSRPN